MNVYLRLTPNSGLHFGPDGRAFDIGAMAEIETLLGRPKLLALLSDFRSEIARLLLPDGLAPDTLSRNAHGLVSASGMLGFTALSHACAAVEEGCRRQADPDGLRLAAREAGHSALAALAIITARLA